MKWFIILVLVIGGAICYYSTRTPGLRTDTPRGTATVFIEAALAGDTGKVRGLCLPTAVSEAESIAKDIAASSPDPGTLKWTNTTARQSSLTAITTLISGRVLAVELAQEGAEYRIAYITMDR